jgi:hypothetical protein
MLRFSFLLLCFVLSGCGYKAGLGDLPREYCTIQIPYVDGDRDGDLTRQIVEKMAASSTFRYVPYGGDLLLCVKILNYTNDNIGFRYDRNKEDELTHSIIPTETRLTVLTEVKVIDRCQGLTVLGPVRITSSVDFDHDYYGPRRDINVKSLGQLSDIDVAFDSALYPLNRNLAEKIVDYVIHSW